MAHANSILDSDGVRSDLDANKANAALADKALVDRLDAYYEDPELVKGTIGHITLRSTKSLSGYYS